MAIVKKNFPYEILIRFSEGAEHQLAKLGEFEGAHFIERTRLVDDQTGEIVGTPKGEENDRPKDLPREKVQEYLGAQFVQFEAQYATLRKAFDDLQASSAATIADLNGTVAEHIANITGLTAERDALAARSAVAV